MKNGKLAGACGLIFAVLSGLILFIAPAFPTLATPAGETLHYYMDSGRGFLFGNFVAAVALIPSLCFASYFADKLERSQKGPSKNLFLLAAGICHAVAFVSLIGFQTAGLISHPG